MGYDKFSGMPYKDYYEKNFLRCVIPSPSAASAYITGEYLKQLSGFVNTVYGGPLPTELLTSHGGPKSRWKTLLSDHGWRVQVRLYHYRKRKYRILDPNSHVAAIGTSCQILRPMIEHHIEQSKTARMRREGKNRIAIVFNGGGAKGAYQIGVWRWLRGQSGLDKDITGISGASVGALNSLLFANGDLELAEKVWNDLRQDDLTPLYKIPIRVGNIVGKAGALAGALAIGGTVASAAVTALSVAALPGVSAATLPNAVPLISAALAASGVKGIELDDLSLFPRDRLLSIVTESGIAIHKILDSDILAFSSLCAFRHVPHPQHLIRQQGYQKGKAVLIPEYRCWQSFAGNDPCDELVDTVLASAAYPIYYAPKEINGIAYWDGGLLDNSPVTPLIKAGFEHIIVIHLEREPALADLEQTEQYRAGIRMPGSADYPLRRIYHVIPSCELGKTFHTSGTNDRFVLGYNDAQSQLSQTLLPFLTR